MSRLENFDIGRALARAFNIKGMKNQPVEMDTSSFKPVAVLEPGMLAAGQVQLLVSTSIAGLSIWDWQGVGSDGAFTAPAGLGAAAGVWRSNGESEAVILGLRVEVAFPGNLPIVAEDGAVMELSEYRQAANNTTSYIKMSSFRPAMVVNQAQGTYIWSYPMWVVQPYLNSDPPTLTYPPGVMAASPIYIPAGSRWGLTMTYWTNPTTLRVFPAGTTVSIYAFLTTCPKGMRPPGM